MIADFDILAITNKGNFNKQFTANSNSLAIGSLKHMQVYQLLYDKYFNTMYIVFLAHIKV